MSSHCGIGWSLGVVLALVVCLHVPVLAENASGQLEKAVELFEEGQLQKSQEALKKIDESALTEEEQEQYQEFSKQLRVALGLAKKAENDFASAEKLFKSGTLAESAKLYQAVTENGFSSEKLIESSEKRLADIEKKQKESLKSDKPAEQKKPAEKTDKKKPDKEETVKKDLDKKKDAANVAAKQEKEKAEKPREVAKAAEKEDSAKTPKQKDEAEVAGTEKTAKAAEKEDKAEVAKKEDGAKTTGKQAGTEAKPEQRLAASQPSPPPVAKSEDVDKSPPAEKPDREQKQVAGLTKRPQAVMQAPPPSAAKARPAVSPVTIAEAKAANLVKQGQQATQEAQYDRAIALFDEALRLVPGLPEAVKGKDTALQHQTAEQSEKTSLVQKIRNRDAVLWERAVATYRKVDEEIRENVIKGNFDEAKRLLLVARQVIQSNRIYAEPVERYGNLKSESEALASFVADEERRWNEEEIRRRRDEAALRQEERHARTLLQREEKIQSLMDQAFQLRKEREYQEAIAVLKQVSAIDPANDKARWFLADLEDLASYQEQVATRDSINRENRGLKMDIQRSMIPWHKDVLFPSNWLELTARRMPSGAGEAAESPENRALQEKLQKTIPEVTFEDTAFEEVIQFLSDENEVNVHVNWNALEIAGIDRETEVGIKLRNVRFEKALELILDDVGGGEVQLGSVIDEGVLQISTQEELITKTYTEVYDIRDLIIDIPSNYNAPQLDLSQITQASSARGGGSSQSIFRDDNREDSQEREEKASELVTSILELIRSTIDPDTWRESGGVVGSLREMNGLLVVTQTSSAHKELRDLFERLRGPRAIQIAVETRFLTVGTNFLEEIGTDLDIILNQGNAGFDMSGGSDTYGMPAGQLTDSTTGGRYLIPREFSRLGVLPTVTPTGTPFSTLGGAGGATFFQPYAQAGVVPAHGQVGPHSSQWTPIPLLNNTLNLAGAQRADTGVPGTFGGGQYSPAFQTFGSFLDNIQVDFLLRATQADSRSTHVEAPRVVLFNGQRSYVAVTRTRAYISDLEVVIGDQAGAPDPEVSAVSSGTVLDVEATVSADRRYVTLTMAPSIATVLDIVDFPVIGGALNIAAGIIQLPEVQVTSIRTSVQVPDGGTILLGGQKLAGEVEIEAGVPILSKIPGLKRAFSNRSVVKDEQTILILVQPKIILQKEAEEEAFPTISRQD